MQTASKSCNIDALAGRSIVLWHADDTAGRMLQRQVTALGIACHWETSLTCHHENPSFTKDVAAGADIIMIDRGLLPSAPKSLQSTIDDIRELSKGPLMLVEQAQSLGGIGPHYFDHHISKPLHLEKLICALAAAFGVTQETQIVGSCADTNKRANTASIEVLIVEDNAVNQMLAMTILRNAGHSVEIASNGVEALQALDRRSFDVILMDMQMPEMDGLEATRRIRQIEDRRNQIPIIAMTANAMTGDRERCIDAGMNDYLSKPIDQASLLRTVLRWSDQDGTPISASSAITGRDTQTNTAESQPKSAAEPTTDGQEEALLGLAERLEGLGRFNDFG